MKRINKTKVKAIIKETLGWVTDDRKLERAGKADRHYADRSTGPSELKIAKPFFLGH
jgi:hypothetical protein